MTKKSFFYIFLIILTCGIYYSYQKEDPNLFTIPSQDLANYPTYQSGKMQTLIYAPTGYLTYDIDADEVKHFDNTGQTYFKAPNITLFQQENQAAWNITSQTSILTDNKLFIFDQDVVLINLLPNTQLQKIMTDNAQVDLSSQIVTSQAPVTIYGEHFTSTGIGLHGDLKSKTADILQNVKTIYQSTNFIEPEKNN